jgi:hypothetical protein
MDDQQSTDKQGSTPINWDKWVALATIFIALCALGSSFWQGYTLQQHNKLSIRPFLEFEANIQPDTSGKYGFELMLNNNGLGPADILSTEFLVNGKQLKSAHDIWSTLQISLPLHCLGAGNVTRFYKVNDRQMVIRAMADECLLSAEDYRRLLKSLKIKLTYQSLYGEVFHTEWVGE